jgi:hypothetical protein
MDIDSSRGCDAILPTRLKMNNCRHLSSPGTLIPSPKSGRPDNCAGLCGILASIDKHIASIEEARPAETSSNNKKNARRLRRIWESDAAYRSVARSLRHDIGSRCLRGAMLAPVWVIAAAMMPRTRAHGRHRVLIVVEAHLAGLGVRRRHCVESIEPAGIRNEPRPLRLEHFPDRLLGQLRMVIHLGVGNAFIEQPGVQFVKILEQQPRRKDALAD